MILLRYIAFLLTTPLLTTCATSQVPARPTPFVSYPPVTATLCTPGKCCEFTLNLYQRCIPQTTYYENHVQTWPLFHAFKYKNGTPIAPITGDYNRKACVFEDCRENSVGNITGPNDFYMRWQYQEDFGAADQQGRDKMTYWFQGLDHVSWDRCWQGKWTEYHDQLRKWTEDCRMGAESFANRTRVGCAEVEMEFGLFADCVVDANTCVPV
jgi:hypothetical protein